MARKKSLIPVKIQIPAALVLAVFFVALLVFRASKSDGDRNATVQAANYDAHTITGSEAFSERVAVDDLRNRILNFQNKPETEPVTPRLEQNPFLIPEDAFTRAMPDRADLGDEPDVTSELDRSRARELNSMILTGTSKIGDQYMAIVDGIVLGKGDRIDGYTIVEVGEGILIIENRRGVRIVRMKEGGSR